MTPDTLEKYFKINYLKKKNLPEPPNQQKRGDPELFKEWAAPKHLLKSGHFCINSCHFFTQEPTGQKGGRFSKKMSRDITDVLPAVGEFAEYLVAAGVVEVTLGADHIQGTPAHKT